MRFSVRSNLREVMRTVDHLEQKSVQWATINALNATAKDVQAALVAEMKRVFDRPTRFTLNSTYLDKARRGRLYAEVKIKDEVVKGNAAIRYLAPQIYGGARAAKKFEVLLQRQGILPRGWVTVPGYGAKLDRYGNISGGQYTRILSALGALRDDAQNRGIGPTPRRGRRRNPARIFVEYKNGRPIGIFEVQGRSKVAVLLYFVRQASYRRRFDFFGVADRAASAAWPRRLDEALAAELQRAGVPTG